MSVTNYYFSLQYSAIQKTILRHDRLWSIAGISNLLSRLNEIELPRLAEEVNGRVVVAGGGKFTARFPDPGSAERAKRKCIALLSTTLPMLEFQASTGPHFGVSFAGLAKDPELRHPVTEELAMKKRSFRGHAVSFNPHLKLCSACGEYPAQENIVQGRRQAAVCRICRSAFFESKRCARTEPGEERTTLQEVYARYMARVSSAAGKEPAMDFSNLFVPIAGGGDGSGERRRMAVWLSDLNNMRYKVPAWLRQQDDDRVAETFLQFREAIVEIVVQSLVRTFSPLDDDRTHLPFRLVVAGGDDLCIVMAEEYILGFVGALSRAHKETVRALPPDHPLHETSGAAKPFGFGGCFIVAPIHAPFSRIHRLGEDLMSEAKKKTDRMGNSVNWRIMAGDHPATDLSLRFDRPLFIETEDAKRCTPGALSFADFMELRRACGENGNNDRKLSTSHLHQIVGFMRAESNPHEIERRMKLLDSSASGKSFSPLLTEPRLRDREGVLRPERLATLFELLSISGGER